jgi:hypothetical protein
VSDQGQASPGLIAAMLQAMRRFGQGASAAPDARAASQQIAQQLPEAVMPNEALAEMARRRAMLDAMTKGE